MNRYPYRILMSAGLAMFIGVAGAQTYGDKPATMPADKNAPQNVQAQPSSPPDPMRADPASKLTPADTNAPQQVQKQTPGAPDQANADKASRLPAVKGATENTPSPVESTRQPTDKISGQANAQAKSANQESRKVFGSKSTKSAHHESKPRSQPEQTAMQGEKAYREALRQCAKEQDQNARDSCLDNAIQQFHRNT